MRELKYLMDYKAVCPASLAEPVVLAVISYFGETQSSQTTRDESIQAAKTYQKGMARYLPYLNSAKNLATSGQ